MKRLLPAVAVLAAFTHAVHAQAAPTSGVFLYVAVHGDDAGPGTTDKPFRTLHRAQAAAREAVASAKAVTVGIGEGVYLLDRPLVFEPADCGRRPDVQVQYMGVPNRPTVLSGGRRVTGWARCKDNVWKAPSPVDDFRQFYVNHKRGIRARGKVPAGLELVGNEGYRTSDPAIAKWKNIDDVEFCYLVVWTHSRCRWATVRPDEKDKSKLFIAMQQPTFEQARTKEGVQVSMPAYVENAFELLDEPGEFYLDRPARTIYYIPRESEDLAKAEVIVPALDTLVEVRGTPEEPVCGVAFFNLTFADATWLQPSRIGHADVQANFLNDPGKLLRRDGKVTTVHNEQLKSPGNIRIRHGQGIRFSECTFTRLGGAGLDIDRGSHSCEVHGCDFHDIAGSAVQIGDVNKDDHHPSDERLIVRDIRVTDCLIHDCCLDYKGGVGVFLGYVKDCRVAHNEIRDLPYSGVSAGWGWGEEDAGGGAYKVQGPPHAKPTPCGGNVIEKNHIHHVMKELNDGGGIYTLGNQPGTVIRGNHIHDDRGGPGGIYLDEGSGFIEITGNAVHDVPRPMNYNNRAQDRIKTCNEHDNYFNVKPPPKNVVEQAGPEAGH
ncbi:MAG: hypothetical protein BWX88_01529 [Planctomycetes bacterium ADurb.Bin126]|nr:MAG: hypothetical protein BWX88_01529 [Planctomycetes bacterium ADurb.Bin126]HOD84669.1 right-handed parallel beta-helix repeat-containing protein [Phycisphaerae bacterium]HQL73578.1 right-handed parallel beta-helix repeat-containing protein [Phycisphaerae bacterium]